MSLVYRAIWQDDRAELCTRAVDDLRNWVRSKYAGALVVPDLGAAETSVRVGGVQCDVDISVEFADSDGEALTAVRATLAEAYSGGSHWKTTLRAWQDRRSEQGFAWVDLSVVGDDVDLRTLAPAAPRLVRTMLARAETPRVDSHPIWLGSRVFLGADGGEQLAEMVSDFDRTLPMVVFARDDSRFAIYGAPQRYSFEDIIARVADRAAGVANIAVLDAGGADAFTAALGNRHGVWEGAFRVYLRNLDPAAPDDSWRHRYVTADRYMGEQLTAANIVARMLSTISPTRRPPESFSRAKDLLSADRRNQRDHSELMEYADSEIERLTQEIVELREQVGARDEQILGFEIDQLETLQQLETSTELARKLQRRVGYCEGNHTSFTAVDPHHDDPAESIPLTAANSSDAVDKARQHLSDRLVIPDAALKDLDKLDSAVNSASWGQHAWRGFLALHAYARALAADTATCGFWDWCDHSHDPLAWPARNKRLAMTESDSVIRNPKLRAQRVLPVSTEVDADGTIFMGAHMKIAEGGGDLAPRIYFHVDTVRCTVHVGFFGPHAHMRNTRS